MSADFSSVFAILKPLLGDRGGQLQVKTDTAIEYTVVTKSPSPYKQHKGEPLFFGSLRVGKAYVSYHLLPLYMNPELTSKIPAGLKKRMQGKACFNFKSAPSEESMAELRELTDVCVETWAKQKLL